MKWLWIFPILLIIWIVLELIARAVAQKGIKTDFYGGISRADVLRLQARHGVMVVTGTDWLHLGWIADPEQETYRVEQEIRDDVWSPVGEARYGSWLGNLHPGHYRVIAVNKKSGFEREVGRAVVEGESRAPSDFAVPGIASDWHPLFKPEKTGRYINDHCLYQDGQGKWRLIGITSQTQGDYSRETYFASAMGENFPPKQPFIEMGKMADFGTLAWAPDVVTDNEKYHLYWSPHQLHHVASADGVDWKNHQVIIEKPMHPFFRDAMIYKVAPGQWLLYATGRGKWFSRIDIYQSFDLIHWQYIRPAIRCGWGSEKNFVTGSMESPYLFNYGGNYYLSTTYNNDSFFWTAILLQMGIILNRKDYNNTLVFGSHNPYDFGLYNGKRRSSQLVSQLETHAPIYVQSGERWYLTTCGWPFAASLTGGEAAWAELKWDDGE